MGVTANGRGFLLGWRECSGTRQRWPRLHSVVNVLNATEQYAVEMVNFTLCEFHFNLKKGKERNSRVLWPTLLLRPVSPTPRPPAGLRACRSLHLPSAPEARASPEAWEPPRVQHTLAGIPGEAGGD